MQKDLLMKLVKFIHSPRLNLGQTCFERFLLDLVAATRAHDGASASLVNCQLLPPIDEWQFPKYPGRTVILPPDADLLKGLRRFITENESLLCEADCQIGLWVHPHTGQVYLDITTSCADLEEARRVALDVSTRDGRKIVALYNAVRGETVYL